MIKRKLKYTIKKNNFRNGYYASMISKEIIFENHLVFLSNMLSNDESQEFTQELKNFFLENLIAGNTINVFNLFTIQPQLKGPFASLDDCYDPDRHYFELSIKPGPEYSNLFHETELKLKKITSIKR